MTDPTYAASAHDIVAVYRDHAVARRVAQQVEALGVAPGSIRMDDAATRVESLKAEMREEADNTIVGPGNVGPFTTGMTKGVVKHVGGWAVALTLLCLPLGLVEWWDVALGTRLAIAAIVGAVTGATIGFVAGGGFGAEGPNRRLAAERGVTLAVSVVDSLAPRVVSAMRDADPIRLDLGSLEGNPVDTIMTEEDTARRS
ncbi:MAG TPA: hypothetical protein VF230_18260 [Acidimicrobiales bacterium]